MIPALFKAKWGDQRNTVRLLNDELYCHPSSLCSCSIRPAWRERAYFFPQDPHARCLCLPAEGIRCSYGWIISLILVFVAYIYIAKTKHGYEISVVGDSPNTARYAGINVSRVLIRTMFLSAALCGLVGFLQVSGSDGTLTENTANGVGFTAITVAWLAKMNPFAMVLVSLFIAVLERGSSSIQTSHGIPSSAASLLTGIILFFMLGCEFFINYRLVHRGRKRKYEMDIVFNLLTAAVLAGTPLLLGTLGEILTEKSGNLNLGVEGMMFMGAIAGIAGSWFTEQWFSGGGFAAAFVGLISFFPCGLPWRSDLCFSYDYAPCESECYRSDLRSSVPDSVISSANCSARRPATLLRLQLRQRMRSLAR